MEWILVLIAVLVVAGAVAALVVRGSKPGPEFPAPTTPDQSADAPVESARSAELSSAPLADETADRLDEAAPPVQPADSEIPVSAPPVPSVDAPSEPRSLRDRLGRARSALSGVVSSMVGRSSIDQDTWDELEESLIRADVGVGLTQSVLDGVRARLKADGGADVLEALRTELRGTLIPPTPLRFSSDGPSVFLFVGVNGVGKTTTIGKVGRRLVDEGHSVVMAAGDTFRAAAAEQLETWADRCGASLVRGTEGSDPSSVIFDGIAHAAAAGADVVLADTAGRLHTKSNLMEELSKVRRVADKGAGEVCEVLLVLDATTGQNGLTQARQFAEAVDITGVVLTKLDGSAKGGIVFAIGAELGVPVKLVGLGETAGDLIDFDPDAFVDALLEP